MGGALERGWLYAGGLLPVAETDADGSTVRRVFVYATRANVPDLVRQLEGAAWVTYRVLVDHLGSVRSVVRASDGAVMQRMDYDAFGGVVDDWSASGWVRGIRPEVGVMFPPCAHGTHADGGHPCRNCLPQLSHRF